MLIVISTDPRASHRPAEAVRVAAGLAALGELSIEVCFSQAGALILSQPASALVDGDIIQQSLPLLAKHAANIWAETGDPFLKGEKQIDYQRIGLDALAKIAGRQSRVIRF